MAINDEKELLASFTVLNKEYGNPSFRFIRGLQDASSSGTAPTAGTIDNPRDTGVPMRPTVVDPKICSFIYNGEARFLLAKVVTPVSGHDGEDTVYSMIAAPTPPYGSWSVLAKDILLQYPPRNGAPVATNPRGLAQNRGFLHIADWDSQKIYTVGTDELNGLTDGTRFTLTREPFDVSAAAVAAGAAALPADAKGQAIILIKDNSVTPGQRYLFVLFVVSDNSINPQQPEYDFSILVRLKVDENGNMTYDAQTTVGKNAVEIIPISRVTPTSGDSEGDGTSETYLLIPAMGGPQKGGAANGEASNVYRVPAFGNWTGPSVVPALIGETGRGDFRAIAASDRADGAGIVYILIGYFNSLNYNGFTWELFKSTVDKMIASEEATITEAIADGTLVRVDFGTTISPNAANPYGIYFWDVLYETSVDATDSKDRLHFFKGSALQVTPAGKYPNPAPDPDAIQPPSDDPAPVTGPGYVLFPLGVRDGRMGGYNVDSADLSAETLRQYKAGVSLKRGAKATHITV